MNDVCPSGESYPTDTVLEQENQVIAEAKNLLYARLQTRGQILSSPQTVQDYLRLQLSEQQREIFCGLFLNSQHQLIEYRELFLGTIDSCSVYPREVVKAALRLNAAAIIFAHNHPSGVPEPSAADRRITEQLKNALALLDVRVLDHFVVGDDAVISFAERGWI
jgi:DNA repair protein RadC